jgi:hypothetical protein
MITQADVIEVMSYVVACHHRTAPRMDDREATLVTARIWADLFNEYRLELPDLLAAVKKRGARIESAPEPAEIIKFAREIRQDRTDRESDRERAEREARNDRKTLDYDQALRRITQRTGQKAVGARLSENLASGGEFNA